MSERDPIVIADAAQVAAYLQVSPRTVQRLVDRGKLKPTPLGGRRFFRWRDLLASLGWRPETADRTDGEIECLPKDQEGGMGDDATARPTLLTLDQVAARLRCSPREVRALGPAGRLAPVRIGGVERWWLHEVEALARAGGRDDPAV